MLSKIPSRILFIVCLIVFARPVFGQRAPSQTDINGYVGLHRAAHRGDIDAITKLVAQGADLESRDRAGRTPLHIAAFTSNYEAFRTLAKSGADLNALENDAYDVITISAVANDKKMVDLALSLGASPGNVTSPYQGTALIAASHLGHHDVVKILVVAGAPLDHVNNLGWTALIESVILGNGGPNHIECVRILIEGGADTEIADRQNITPLEHARSRGYAEMVELLKIAN